MGATCLQGSKRGTLLLSQISTNSPSSQMRCCRGEGGSEVSHNKGPRVSAGMLSPDRRGQL